MFSRALRASPRPSWSHQGRMHPSSEVWAPSHFEKWLRLYRAVWRCPKDSGGPNVWPKCQVWQPSGLRPVKPPDPYLKALMSIWPTSSASGASRAMKGKSSPFLVHRLSCSWPSNPSPSMAQIIAGGSLLPACRAFPLPISSPIINGRSSIAGRQWTTGVRSKSSKRQIDGPRSVALQQVRRLIIFQMLMGNHRGLRGTGVNGTFHRILEKWLIRWFSKCW